MKIAQKQTYNVTLRESFATWNDFISLKEKRWINVRDK